jgi:hypothetical protein
VADAQEALPDLSWRRGVSWKHPFLALKPGRNGGNQLPLWRRRQHFCGFAGEVWRDRRLSERHYLANVDHRDNIDVVPEVELRDKRVDDLRVVGLDQAVAGGPRVGDRPGSATRRR